MTDYLIRFTDYSVPPIQVDEDTIDRDSVGVSLIGRIFQNYGEDVNRSLLNLLENFSCPENNSTTDIYDATPDITYNSLNQLKNPIIGQFWYNSTRKLVYTYDGNKWNPLSQRGTYAANWGQILNGQQLPKPINQDGYVFNYDECIWSVSPAVIMGAIDGLLCNTDSEAFVTMKMRYIDTSKYVNGVANYLIIGIKDNQNNGFVPTPTPTTSLIVSLTPTPEPTVTPTVTRTPGSSITPTPVVSNTPMSTITSTPVPSSGPIPSATRTPTIGVTSTPISSVTPTPMPTVTSTPVPTVTPTSSPSMVTGFGFGTEYSADSYYSHDVMASMNLTIESNGAWSIGLTAIKSNNTNGDPRTGNWYDGTPVGSNYDVKFDVNLSEMSDTTDPMSESATIPDSTGWLNLGSSRSIYASTFHVIGAIQDSTTYDLVDGTITVSIRNSITGTVLISETFDLRLNADTFG